MQFVPYRLLRNQPKELRQKLGEEGQLIVTSNGEPFALMISVGPDEVGDVVYMITQLRAQLAVSAMRATARTQELDHLTAEEIEAEIEAVRRER